MFPAESGKSRQVVEVSTELKLGSTVSLSGGATTLPGDALDARIPLEVVGLVIHRA
jgi:hypothetical protein